MPQCWGPGAQEREALAIGSSEREGEKVGLGQVRGQRRKEAGRGVHRAISGGRG